MSKARLNVHYMYFIPLLILQVLATTLVVSVMSVTDYGLYTLYLTTINVLYIITMGIPDGYLLTNRMKSKSKITGIYKLLANYGIMLFIFLAIGLLVIQLLGLSLLYRYALLASIIAALYHLTQTIFRTLNEAHKQNIYLIFTRTAFVGDGLVYWLTGNLEYTLIFDIVCRFLIMGATIIQILYEYRDNDKVPSNYSQYFHVGLIVMLSNTIFNLSLMVDKYALSSDLENLGMYSLAITVVLLFRVVLMPLNQVLLVTLDEKNDMTVISKKIIPLIILLYSLLIPALYVGKYIINNIAFLSKYIGAVPIIAITILMIPLMVPLESVIITINKLTNSKLFFVKSILVAFIFCIVLFSYTSYAIVDLTVYSKLVVICYLSSFVIYSYGILKNKQLLTIIFLYIILGYIYIYLCNNFIL